MWLTEERLPVNFRVLFARLLMDFGIRFLPEITRTTFQASERFSVAQGDLSEKLKKKRNKFEITYAHYLSFLFCWQTLFHRPEYTHVAQCFVQQ